MNMLGFRTFTAVSVGGSDPIRVERPNTQWLQDTCKDIRPFHVRVNMGGILLRVGDGIDFDDSFDIAESVWFELTNVFIMIDTTGTQLGNKVCDIGGCKFGR
jgi:hypothetical protein